MNQGISNLRKIIDVSESYKIRTKEDANNLIELFKAPSSKKISRDSIAIEFLKNFSRQTDHLIRHSNDEIRLNYAKGFERDFQNFQPRYILKKGKLDDDLVIVQFHSDEPCSDRSLKWWTTSEQANSFSTVEDIRTMLALPPDWGPRNTVTLAVVPKDTDITAYFGKASEQICRRTGFRYPGGGNQYRFKDFNPEWMKFSGKIEWLMN